MLTFDIVIIGGGVAGLVAASGAAQLGARAALIDRRALGGDCLHYGCVPTKRLIECARHAHNAKKAAMFGVECRDIKIDFNGVMASVRAAQADIGRRDSIERFTGMGVAVHIGTGRFKDPQTFEVNGEEVRGEKFLIATGSGPFVPKIPGLLEATPLTNESALGLNALPETLIILGAGPIGIEFAQAFSRLGSKVTVIEMADRILPREEPELTDMLKKTLEDEGITFELSTEVKEVKAGEGLKTVHANGPGGAKTFTARELMVSIGRVPNVDGLGLEAAGVECDRKKGVYADEFMRTSAKHIYAAGDVIGGFAFTHVAEYQAGVALRNALFPFAKSRVDYGVVPWATFTDPELARVGLTEKEAVDRYGKSAVRVYRHDFTENDRAVIEGNAVGRIKLVCNRNKHILGAHILGPRAGELIHEYALAMAEGIPVKRISRLIHIYPTLSQAVKRTCDEYYREKLFKGWFPKISKWIIRRGGAKS